MYCRSIDKRVYDQEMKWLDKSPKRRYKYKTKVECFPDLYQIIQLKCRSLIQIAGEVFIFISAKKDPRIQVIMMRFKLNKILFLWSMGFETIHFV